MANTRNVSLETIYGGKFTLSTHLIKPHYILGTVDTRSWISVLKRENVQSDERLGAKLRVKENRCVLFNSSIYIYINVFFLKPNEILARRNQMIKGCNYGKIRYRFSNFFDE